MKLKYYLRGLGIGIIVTTIILAVSFSKREVRISDAEVMERAAQLGMVMPGDETEEPEENIKVPDEDTQTKEEPQDEEGIKVPDSEADGNTDAGADTQVSQNQQDDTQTSQGTSGDTTPAQDMPADTPTSQDASGNTPASQDTLNDTQVPQPASTYRLTIQKGDVCRVVCEDLAANGIIEDAEAFRKYLFELGYASNMSTGKYDVPYGLTMEEVAAVLQAGPVEK